MWKADLVTVSNPELGRLTNRMRHGDCEPWNFGLTAVRGLMRRKGVS